MKFFYKICALALCVTLVSTSLYAQDTTARDRLVELGTKIFLKQAVESNVSARVAANEASAVGTLRTIFSAQQQFRVLKKDGGNFAESLKALADEGLISKSIASGARSGYKFKITRSSDGQSFQATALPLSSDTGRRGFLVTSQGSIHFTKDGSVPTSKSPKVGSSSSSQDKKITLSSLKEDASKENREKWNSLVKELAGDDQEKAKKVEEEAWEKIRKRMEEKASGPMIKLLILFHKTIKDPSLRRDPEIRKKVKNLSSKSDPLMKALFGNPGRKEAAKILERFSKEYASPSEREKIKEVLKMMGGR